jgi:hypothetical protein
LNFSFFDINESLKRSKPNDKEDQANPADDLLDRDGPWLLKGFFYSQHCADDCPLYWPALTDYLAPHLCIVCLEGRDFLFKVFQLDLPILDALQKL